MRRIKPIPLLILLVCLLPLSLVGATMVGAVTMPLADVIDALFFRATAEIHQSIILSIRLPRALLAAFIGALLAVSGAITQGLFRNPLADPSLIGVTAGALMGASIAIVCVSSGAVGYLISPWLGLSVISIAACVGGFAAVWLVYRLAKSQYGTSVATMLLAGIGVTALASSIISLLEFIADNEMLRRMSLWRQGGLEGANSLRLAVAATVCVFMCAVLPRCSQSLNALLLGESEARHLGIHVEQLKRMLIVLVAVCVGISVALAGTITFVGLVVPHIVRLTIGPDHRFLLPASALMGAVLLVLADIVSRTLLAPTELPVGLVIAFIGVPFFISLLQRRYVYGQ